jgi:hypothetical protein
MADYSTLLRGAVTLTCRSIDRIFLQGYVPNLQSPGLVARFLLRRGFRYPSSAALGKIGDAYVRVIHRFAEANDIPVVHFNKGESKEEIARPYLQAAAERGEDRVVLLGIAQEKASVWRSWKRKGTEGWSRPRQEWGRQMAMINHFYFYIWDREWGPAFWKTNAYAPFPIWIWLNGHEWAKRQLEKAGIGYAALDNGFASCDDPRTLQRVCDRLGPGPVKSFFWRWCRRLPSPFTRGDLRSGIVYDLAFRQLEVSDTRVFDRPASGRGFFEGCIRDHLDLGRPEEVAIIFGRRVTRQTPGAFRTKVITKGVDPQIVCYYRSSRLKQYFKEHRAVRTETVICDTHDFGIGRRVNHTNWQALRAVGEAANARLCDAMARDAAPAPDVVTVATVTRPSKTLDGLHAPGLRFGDPRTMALFSAMVGFVHLIAGFTNAELTRIMGALLNQPYTSRQATYDLRRLRRKGLIERRPGTHRYLPTPFGREIAVLFTKTHARVLSRGLAILNPALPLDVRSRHPLAVAWRQLDNALDDFFAKELLAA